MIGAGRPRTRLSVLIVLLLCVQCSLQQFISLGGGNSPQTSNGNSASCNYLTSIGSNGRCVVTTVDVDRRFKALRDDLSMDRLKNFAQNSIVQQQLAKLTDTDSKLTIRLDGLQRDFLALKSQAGSSGTAGCCGTGSANIQQLQANMLSSIQALDAKLTNWTKSYQNDQVNQAQIDALLQQQLTQLLQDNVALRNKNNLLTQDFTNLQKDMQSLTVQVRVLAARGTGVTSGPPVVTAAPVTVPVAGPTIAPSRTVKLEQDVQALQQALQQQQANQSTSQALSKLSADLKAAQTLLNNHTLQFVDATTERLSLDRRLQAAETTLNNVYQLVQSLNSPTNGLNSRIRQLSQTTNNLSQQLQSLQTASNSLLNSSVFTQVELNSVKNDLVALQLNQTKYPLAILQLDAGINKVIGQIDPKYNNQLSILRQNVANILNGPPQLVVPPIINPSGGQTTPPIIMPPLLTPPGPG